MCDVSKWVDGIGEAFDDLDYSFSYVDPVDVSSGIPETLRDASTAGVAARAGLQVESLQSAMDGYAKAMDRAAIAKSTGLPALR